MSHVWTCLNMFTHVWTRPSKYQAGTTPGRFKTSSYLENNNRKSYTRPVWSGIVAKRLSGCGWIPGRYWIWPVQDQTCLRPVTIWRTLIGSFKTSSYLENNNRKSYTRPVWSGIVAKRLSGCGWIPGRYWIWPVQDQTCLRPVTIWRTLIGSHTHGRCCYMVVQPQVGTRPVAICRTLIGSHTHGWSDLVLGRNVQTSA